MHAFHVVVTPFTRMLLLNFTQALAESKKKFISPKGFQYPAPKVRGCVRFQRFAILVHQHRVVPKDFLIVVSFLFFLRADYSTDFCFCDNSMRSKDWRCSGAQAA